MAPEQIGLNTVVTRRADLYPAGVVLWELLTGGRLFDGRSDAETLNLVLRGSMRPPSEMRADVGEDIDAIVMRALERDPADRFETALDFADALENLPVRPATARVVGTFVQETLADSFKRRRDLLRRCLDAAPIVIERPPAPPSRLRDDYTQRSAAPTRRSRPTALRRRKRSRALSAAIAAVVATLGALLAVEHFRPRSRNGVGAINPVSVAASLIDHSQPAARPDPASRATVNTAPMIGPATVAQVSSAPPAGSSTTIPADARPSTMAVSNTDLPTHHHHRGQHATSPQSATPTRFTPHSI